MVTVPKVAVIMHGGPGSGKSTRATEIVSDYARLAKDEEKKSYEIISTDNFWLDENGNYIFNPSRLREAHNWCFRQWHEACFEGLTLVVLDNTNMQKTEWENYAYIAKVFGYSVQHEAFKPKDFHELLKWAKRNTHGVPVAKVFEMYDRWEDPE
jgi:tRNA uridine 5-carbamoylmethylation protein Kti12